MGYSQQVVAEYRHNSVYICGCLHARAIELPASRTEVNPNTGAWWARRPPTGTYIFAVRLKDNAFVPLSATSDLFTVVINPATPLGINSGVLPNATVGSLYEALRCKLRAERRLIPGACRPIPCRPGSPSTRQRANFWHAHRQREFTISFPTVTDSTIPPQTFTSPASKPVTITVTGAATLKAVTPTLPSGAVATAYSANRWWPAAACRPTPGHHRGPIAFGPAIRSRPAERSRALPILDHDFNISR